MFVLHFFIKIFAVCFFLLITPFLISLFIGEFLNFNEKFPLPIIDVVKIVISNITQDKTINNDKLEVYLISFFLSIILFIVMYLFKFKSFEPKFDLVTFIISIIIIPTIIDIYFSYTNLSMSYIEFFYPVFYSMIESNFLHKLLEFSSKEESIIIIEMYANTFSYILAIKKYILDIHHKFYIDIFIFFIFFIRLCKYFYFKYSHMVR